MRYDINLEEFKKSTKRIEGDVKLRPFDLKPPIWRWMGIKILTDAEEVHFSILVNHVTSFGSWAVRMCSAKWRHLY